MTRRGFDVGKPTGPRLCKECGKPPGQFWRLWGENDVVCLDCGERLDRAANALRGKPVKK
jgi:hypothetical protein